MNERIKELVKQAGGYFSTRTLTSNPVQYRESVELWDENIEKFAELIARECIEQCSKALVEHTGQPSVTHNYAVGLCQDNIKEHFGVEE